jgi:hypothetical protein
MTFPDPIARKKLFGFNIDGQINHSSDTVQCDGIWSQEYFAIDPSRDFTGVLHSLGSQLHSRTTSEWPNFALSEQLCVVFNTSTNSDARYDCCGTLHERERI